MLLAKLPILIGLVNLVTCADDMVIGQLTTLVQQQAAKIQALEARLTTAETRMTAVESVNQKQNQELASLKSRGETLNQISFQ